MNIKVKRIIGIIIILFLLAAIVLLYYKWSVDKKNETSNNSSNDIVNDDNGNNQSMDNEVLQEVKFKDFTYKVSMDISYDKVDENKFKLYSDYYEAIVEPLVDAKHYVLTNPDDYYEVLLNRGITVSKPEKSSIGLIDIVKYNKTQGDENSVLYYFNYYNSQIVYEVEIIGNQDNMETIFNILLNGSINRQAEFDYREINVS